MPITKTQARKLLNASEFALFESTTATEIKTLSPARLSAKIRRVRALRDKARDQFQRQRLATRDRTGNKRGTSGVANVRTKEKQQVFEDILARLQKRADVLEAKAAKDAAAAEKARGKAAADKKKISSTRRKAANKADRAAVRDEVRSAKRATVAGAKPAAENAAKKPVGKVAKKAVKKTAAKAAEKAPAKTAKGAVKKAAAKAVPSTKPKRSAKAPVPLENPADAATARARTGFVSKQAKNVALQRGFEKSNTTAIHSHISSRGRRNQAKRDSR